MERCFRCKVSEQESVLYDGLYGLEPVKVCDSCAEISGIPIIRAPSANQLKESEKAYGVRERLAKLAGIKLVDKTREAIDSVRQSDKIVIPQINKPKASDLVFKLVDNFHWIIQTTRRRKGITVKQIADAIKESQSAVEMLEKGKIPGDSLDLVMKIEQFLGINLIKRTGFEATQEREQKAFLEQKREEEKEEIIIDKVREENIQRLKELAKQSDDKNVDFSRHSLHGVTVSDLKRINEVVDKDSPKKTSEQTGAEQFEGFGAEDMAKVQRKITRDDTKKDMKKKTPSIYDLMRAKQERDKLMTGKDIDPVGVARDDGNL